MNNYELLIQRLDAFIRKYYANQLLRGFLWCIGMLFAVFLVVSISEYYLYFPSWLRYVLLFLFGAMALFAFIAWIILPFLRMSKLGKIIQHEQAAQILGTHFPEVQDKLLNVLQLKQQANNTISQSLIEASIEQKTRELSPIPFLQAVNLGNNKKYLPYVLPPLFICCIIYWTAPDIFTESTTRLLSPSKQFTPKAPFEFQLYNTNLALPQFSDVRVQVKTTGKSIPDQMYLQFQGQSILMQQDQPGLFSYTLQKVAKSGDFYFTAAGYNSRSYTLEILQKPLIKQFKVAVNYPDYTGRKDDILENIGDIIAPEGTSLQWVFQTEHTDEVLFALGKGSAIPMQHTLNQFLYSYTFLRDTTYQIIIGNKRIQTKDSLQYHVSVIPDQMPSISVQQYNDSLTDNYVLFVGEAADDYGIKQVILQYTIQSTNADGKPAGKPVSGVFPVPIKAGPQVQFNQFLDIETLQLKSGDQLSYYFTACDNDGVHGSKCAKSVVFTYEKPSEKKLDSIIEKTQEQVTKDLNQTAKQNDKLEKELQQMQEKLLQKNELDWQDKKQLEDMVARNENMQKMIDQIQKKFEQNNQKTADKEYSEQVQEKQESLEKLLDELKNNQLQERMKKMEELMKLLNKDQLFDQLKQIEQDNQLMEKDLDRMVEMMKQLERDMRMEDIAKKATELAKKEDELNKATENKSMSDPALKQKQDELNKEMEAIKKDMAEMEKVNEQLEQKSDLSQMKKEEENASEQMQQSSSSLSKGNKSNASKSQKSAKQSLEKLAEELSMAAGGGGGDQVEIDIKAVRQILSNLIRMSFAQEDVIDAVKKTNLSDPKYISNTQTQQKLKADSKMIADSLFVLSKRLAKLSSTVNKEIDAINRNMDKSIENLEGRNTPLALVNQQYVMTGANNLALMLNEVLQQLMQQQAEQQNQGNKSGSGNCSKPGSGPGKKPGKKPGKGMGMQLGDIISKQQQLGSAMEQLMKKSQQSGSKGKEGKQGEQGKEGKSGQQGAGQGNSGQGGSENSGGESEQMARIAAQQAALRKQLNDINQQLKKEGNSHPNLQKIQQDMDRNETDIVNKRLTQEILRRQSEILTRLMETKEAIRQQEQGEERESNTAKEQNRDIPASLQEILKNKQSVIEYYKTVPADLKPYYKEMVDKYFQKIQQSK